MKKCIICPVCGRIHDIKDDKPTVLLCKGCGSLMILNENPANGFPRLLEYEEAEVFLTSDKTCIQVRVSKGIGVPMVGGREANLFCGNRFYYIDKEILISSISAYLYRNGWHDTCLTYRDILERAHDIHPNNQVEVDINWFRAVTGRSRLDALKKMYPNLEVWERENYFYPS